MEALNIGGAGFLLAGPPLLFDDQLLNTSNGPTHLKLRTGSIACLDANALIGKTMCISFKLCKRPTFGRPKRTGVANRLALQISQLLQIGDDKKCSAGRWRMFTGRLCLS